MNSEQIANVIETLTSNLSNPKLFLDSRLTASQSTNIQNQHIADLSRTNQGEILNRLDNIQKDINKVKIANDKLEERVTSIYDHLRNSQSDESLAKKFEDSFNISDEIKSLSKAIEDAKSLNKESLQPDFGWTRRNIPKIDWTVIE